MSPLLVPDVSQLPPTFLYTAEHDGLRDDGLMYVNHLRRQGVLVEHYHQQAGYHGIVFHFEYVPEARKLYENVKNYILKNI